MKIGEVRRKIIKLHRVPAKINITFNIRKEAQIRASFLFV